MPTRACHGAATFLFLAGPGIKGGLHGTHPSPTDLAEGNIKHTVDSRSVYGTLLSDWLKAPNLKPILDAERSPGVRHALLPPVVAGSSAP